MSHIHFLHWFMDFLGVNNTYDSFSTHMYNFWSGFGANVSLLAVSGAIVGVYRHNIERINPVNIIQKVEEQIQKDKGNKESKS